MAQFRADSRVTIDVLANDFDPDGDDTNLRILEVAAGASFDGPNVTVDVADETVQLSYTIEDERGGQASATITVLVTANQPPAVAALDLATSYETAIDIDLSSQATDPDDDVLFYVCCDAIRGGSIDNVSADAGLLRLTFTPNDGFEGQAAFAYTVDDQKGHQVAGSVTITVAPPDNRPPQARDNTVNLPQGATVIVDLAELTSDPDEGDELTWEIVARPGC